MPKELESCRKSVLKQGKTEEESWKICTKKTGWVRKKGGGWKNKKTGELYETPSNFKEYLNNLNEEMMVAIHLQVSKRNLPLTKGLMQRLGYFQDNIEAYHVTNDVYLERMSKNQNKKRTQISCFTKGGNDLSSLPSHPNIVLLLQGDSIISGDTDIYSLPSGRGVRWIDLNHVSNAGLKGEKYAKKLIFYINGVIQKVADKYQIPIDAYKIKTQDLNSILIDLTPKESKMFYKSYMTEIENMLNKHYKELNSYLKSASNMTYDEVVLTNWKILQGWCIGIESPKIVNEFKKYNIPYSGVITRNELKSLKI